MTARITATAHWGEYPAWVDDARVRGITPACDGRTALFFPEKGGEGVPEAKALCRACPLLRTCRAWALQQPAQWLYGVWGGTTQYERRALAPPGEKPASLRKHNR